MVLLERRKMTEVGHAFCHLFFRSVKFERFFFFFMGRLRKRNQYLWVCVSVALWCLFLVLVAVKLLCLPGTLMFHELGLVDQFTVITVYGMHTIINNLLTTKMLFICGSADESDLFFFSLLDKYCWNIHWKVIFVSNGINQIVGWNRALMWTIFERPMAEESCFWHESAFIS